MSSRWIGRWLEIIETWSDSVRIVKTVVKYTPLGALVETDIPSPSDYRIHGKVYVVVRSAGNTRLVISEKILRGHPS